MKQRLAKRLFAAWLLLAALVAVAPLSLHLALLDSLRVPVLLSGAVIVLVILWRRHWRRLALMFVPALALLTPWLASGNVLREMDAQQLKLIILPSSGEKALRYALQEKPDLLFIPDFSHRTDVALAGERGVIHAEPAGEASLVAALPQLTSLYRPWLLKTNDGMGIFVKSGVGEHDDFRVREAQVGSYALVVDARLKGIDLTLAMVHLTRPFPLAGFGRQVRQVERLAGQLAEIPRPMILAGDFNALPWSKALNQLSAAMKAENVQWVGTFPAGSPLKLAIDQVRVSGGLKILSLETGPDLGSAHLPLVATIAIPPR